MNENRAAIQLQPKDPAISLLRLGAAFLAATLFLPEPKIPRAPVYTRLFTWGVSALTFSVRSLPVFIE